jgi:hypothetical protein
MAIAGANALFADPGLLLIAGSFTLLIGLVILLAHHRSSGRALPIVVTIYGWLATLKGLLFLCVSPPGQAQLYGALHLQQNFYAYLVFSLLVGAYLTYEGTRPERA